ncbi:MAG: beta-galactosidase trimerization domain-containing protein [Zavarzinella sp.]
MIRQLIFFCTFWLIPLSTAAEIVVAEGEKFTPQDQLGWKITHQDDSYGSHTYGGMWMTHGGCLGAPTSSENSIAIQKVTIAQAGQYRVWSKYQAPPYFHYLHRVEVIQGGKTVFQHVYGKKGTDRLWSFSGVSDELWWPWGVDHDAAEAPKNLANLQAGEAEIRLITEKNPAPGGDRFIDFILLTTEPADTYEGFKPYRVGSPFTLEAMASTQLYVRFQHNAAQPQALSISRNGHYQPNYGGATTKLPVTPPGQWSEWVNIGPFCRLVHDEGLRCQLGKAANGAKISVQFARTVNGQSPAGVASLEEGDYVVVPIDITWNQKSVVISSQEHARRIIQQAQQWRKANQGKKPQQILFYGNFSGQEKWVTDLKSTLGYNTLLPEGYPQVHCSGLHAHASNPALIKQVAAKLTDKSKFRIMSFGDEIALGSINFNDPENQKKFVAWLKARNVGAKELGIPADQAKLIKTGDPRLVWYSNLFNEESRFADFKSLTDLTKAEIGKHVLTGANYSPHHLALYYGPIYQWIDIFKAQGMSMFWAEDYIFSVPEVPQIISWHFAQIQCAVKYHQQSIHYYVMPHAPGQTPDNLRRNLLYAVGSGTQHVDNFWVAPAERFTENYVSWHYPENFKTLSEAIFDTAEAEPFLMTGKNRRSRIALITGKATDFNESRLQVAKSIDPFTSISKNAPEQLNQIICRKEQQMLYLGLTQAGYRVELITEDDIVDRKALNDYDSVYFAGEWIDHRAVPLLDEWVNAGGQLYVSGGSGHLNEFNAPHPEMLKLLGLKSIDTRKNAVILRTLLELPLFPAIDQINFQGKKVDAIGMQQRLQPSDAVVLGTWKDGSGAITHRKLGKGNIYTVGTLIGNAWMKTGLRQIPYARGGRHCVYHPEKFDETTSTILQLGVQNISSSKMATFNQPHVEAVIRDSNLGSVVTLTSWNNAPLQKLECRIPCSFSPKSVRSVQQQKDLPFQFQNGEVVLTLDLADSDFLLLKK